MRILALVPYPQATAPSQRYRLELWSRYFQGEWVFAPFLDPRMWQILYGGGHLFEKIARTGSAFLRRIRQLIEARSFDLILLHREAALVGPPVLEWVAGKIGVPLVYDFDDAIYLPRSSPANRSLGAFKSLKAVSVACRAADLVIAGNAHLRDYARQWNRNVEVVPSVVDTDRYRPRPERADPRPPVVGWSGTHTVLPYLEIARGPLERLSREGAFRFRLIGPGTFPLNGSPTESVPWRLQTEVEDLQGLDVGLMPVPDDAWGRGKCGMKAILYGGIGIPTVCSPVGVNREIVVDGETGFFADSPAQWESCLRRLARDPRLRSQMGRAARKRVEERYSAKVWGPRAVDLLQDRAMRGKP